MLPQLPPDKAQHVIYGAGIALTSAALALGLHLPHPAGWALGMAALAGVLKEASDRYQNLKAQRAGLLPTHGVEAMDAIATAAGGLCIFIALNLQEWM